MDFFERYQQNLFSIYGMKWIAISMGGRVVATGKSAEKVKRKLGRLKDSILPFVARADQTLETQAGHARITRQTVSRT